MLVSFIGQATRSPAARLSTARAATTKTMDFVFSGAGCLASPRKTIEKTLKR